MGVQGCLAGGCRAFQPCQTSGLGTLKLCNIGLRLFSRFRSGPLIIRVPLVLGGPQTKKGQKGTTQEPSFYVFQLRVRHFQYSQTLNREFRVFKASKLRVGVV